MHVLACLLIHYLRNQVPLTSPAAELAEKQATRVALSHSRNEDHGRRNIVHP
jgi:hypothetical protein